MRDSFFSYSFFCIWLCCLILLPLDINGQSIITPFGKNRVQFHDDFKYWNRYETENFITYFYGKGRNIAQTVVQIAELEHDEIQSLMEHKFNSKIEIVVYTDVTDAKQSNIGIEETFVSKTGQTTIVGNKMFVYFKGDHLKLRRQIREGIATVYINSILFGTNIQEVVQNAVLLNVPTWYKEGIISYAGAEWDYELDDELRDILSLKNGRYWDFERLASDYPKIAGHSLWYFIGQQYGKSTIANILYLTRINRNLENSFFYTLGLTQRGLFQEWQSYYQGIYPDEEGKFEKRENTIQLKLKNKKHVPISFLSLRPGGEYLAYAFNDIGRTEVRLYNFETGEDDRVLKYGHRNAFQESDYNYPLITWSKTGGEMTIVYERRDRIYLRKYYPDTDEFEEDVLPNQIRRVYSLSYFGEDEYVISASTDGFSDLYFYNSKQRNVQRLTEDFYDDLDAQVVNYDGVDGILFRSNRVDNLNTKALLDTILPLEPFDLFFMAFGQYNFLQRLTFTPEENEKQPLAFGKSNITFLNQNSGMLNRFIKKEGQEDNGRPHSNKDRNIILHHSIVSSDKYVYTDYHDGAYKCYLETPDINSRVKPFVTNFSAGKQGNFGTGVLLDVSSYQEKEPIEMQEGFEFQSIYGDPEDMPSLLQKREENKPTDFTSFLDQTNDQKIIEFNSAQIVASRLRFRVDNFTTKMDNEVLFEGLESYVEQDGGLNSIPLGILFKANLKDIFEDYSIEGGMRFPTTFDGSEYFLTFEDRKKRIDKKYALYRKSKSEIIDYTRTHLGPFANVKRTSVLGMAQFKYPFDIFRSLRFTSTLRFDKFFFKSETNPSFRESIQSEQRLSLKAEYVFDNSIDIDINVKNGTRYKFYIEAINQFTIDFEDEFTFEASNGFTTVIGADYRHYIPVLKYGVLALRGAAGTSFGSKKMLYYLGGMENELFPSFSDVASVPSADNIAFQVLAPQFRGFPSNVRNGASYALVNAELRLPIFKLLSRKKIESSILRSFQAVLFYDVGTAWYGLSPYQANDTQSSTTIEAGNVSVNVRYFRNPILMGFGPGVRASLFGYYVKVDYAYGLETSRITRPRFHFSIGMDF